MQDDKPGSRTTELDPELPCGGCGNAGIYDERALLDGFATFGRFNSRESALAAAPQCRQRPHLTCVGCRHFICYVLFAETAHA